MLSNMLLDFLKFEVKIDECMYLQEVSENLFDEWTYLFKYYNHYFNVSCAKVFWIRAFSLLILTAQLT